MPAVSPLPMRDGLGAAKVRTPTRIRGQEAPWQSMVEWLRHKLPAQVDVQSMLDSHAFVYSDGRVVGGADPYTPATTLWFYRELAAELEVPGEMPIVYQDERILVVDKPPFLATTPRGVHVRQTALVRLRAQLDLPHLTPAHRLDRLTSGLLLFTKEPQWRSSYQMLFERGEVRKVYWAIAPASPHVGRHITVRNRIEKTRGHLQASIVFGGVDNAETLVEVEELLGDHARYRLTPKTGQTHQLRVHLNYLGIPIVNDPLYPVVREVAAGDFAHPLQLLAGELSFVDPVDGGQRYWQSSRTLPLPPPSR